MEQVKYRNMCEMMISYVWNLAFIQWLLHSEEKKEDKIGENSFKEVIGISYWTWLFSTTCTNEYWKVQVHLTNNWGINSKSTIQAFCVKIIDILLFFSLLVLNHITPFSIVPVVEFGQKNQKTAVKVILLFWFSFDAVVTFLSHFIFCILFSIFFLFYFFAKMQNIRPSVFIMPWAKVVR